MARVIGVGALNWDRLYRVDRLAKKGEELVIKEFKEEAGGSAANTIAALGILGIECGFSGKVGEDLEGEKILESFKRAGVDLNGILRVKGRTGNVLAFVDDRGERTMYVDPSVNDEFRLVDIEKNYLRGAEIVHLSSFAGSETMASLKGLPERIGGSDLSFSPGFLSAKGVDYLMPLIEKSSYLFLNRQEAYALTGKAPKEAGRTLLDLGAATVFVTIGADGCLLAYEGGDVTVKGFKAEAVDSTGAGDAFTAGALYGVLTNLEMPECARIGNFVASRALGRLGAREGLPKKGDVQDFLKTIG